MISLVLTAHKEGALALPTLRSVKKAMDHARERASVSFEVVVVLDSADLDTTELFRSFEGFDGPKVITRYSDPGLARNHGIGLARGEFVAVMDADNLISENWFVRALEMLTSLGPGKWVLHPEIEIGFGVNYNYKRNIDQRSSEYRHATFLIANYWDTLCFARREIFLEIPYAALNPKAKLGYEDWHWNMEVIARKGVHAVVPGTAHFRRYKELNSMNQQAEAQGFIVSGSPFFDQLAEQPPELMESDSSPGTVNLLDQEWVIQATRDAALLEPLVRAAGPADLAVPMVDCTPMVPQLVGRVFSSLCAGVQPGQDHVLLIGGTSIPPAFLPIIEHADSRNRIAVIHTEGAADAGVVSIDFAALSEKLSGSVAFSILLRVLLQRHPKKIYILESELGLRLLRGYAEALSKNSRCFVFDSKSSEFLPFAEGSR